MAKFVMAKRRLLELIRSQTADNFIVISLNGILTIDPLIDKIPTSSTSSLLGLLADDPEMSVDKFLERIRAERD
jgi:hypothetical protein